MFRNLLIALAIVLCLAPSARAEEEVTLRHSLQDRNLRIVLECRSMRFVQKAEVRSSYSLVKVQFPGEFTFNAPKIPPQEFEYNKKGPSIYLNIKNLKWLKILRLNSPPRLVIDAYLYGQRPEERATRRKPSLQVPGPAPEGEKVKKVVIDPGHGGSDLGVYTTTYTEKQVVLRLALTLTRTLIGKITLLTRHSDRTVSLLKRILYIRKNHPDLTISLHMGTSDIFVIYTPSEEMMKNLEPYALEASQMPYVNKSRRFAELLRTSLQKTFVSKKTEIRDNLPLPVLTHVNTPVVLLEVPSGDFMDYTTAEVLKIANAIKEAIRQYEGQ